MILELIPEQHDISTVKLEQLVHDFVADKEFQIRDVLFFQKAPHLPFDFPQSFVYRQYSFFLKAVAVNIAEFHYYLYMRKGFSHEFYKINDAEMIKCVKWPDIFSDTIFVAMYIVIYDDSRELSHIRKQTQIELSQEQPLKSTKKENSNPMIN